MHTPTAALIIIGNEILSGRTQDTNLSWLGKQLNEAGVALREVRIIVDVEEDIIATVNALRSDYDYVFTTGGIGPTHDDITSECIAKALERKFIRDPHAEALLRAHYGDQINEARLTMADMPEGAELIPNPVSVAPGYRVGNVYVMAGVPRIMQAMFDHVRPTLSGGAPMLSRTLTVFITEGDLADSLARIQQAHPKTEIGSYPFIRDGNLGTSLVIRGRDEDLLDMAFTELEEYLRTLTEQVMEE